MELWIRSQDKERLCKPNNLFIKDYAIFCSYNEQNNDTDYLGVYKTKERALEVLDEIQNILRPQILVRANEDNEKVLLGALQKGVTQKVDMEFKELSTYVYEMPVD